MYLLTRPRRFYNWWRFSAALYPIMGVLKHISTTSNNDLYLHYLLQLLKLTKAVCYNNLLVERGGRSG